MTRMNQLGDGMRNPIKKTVSQGFACETVFAVFVVVIVSQSAYARQKSAHMRGRFFVTGKCLFFHQQHHALILAEWQAELAVLCRAGIACERVMERCAC